MKSARSCGYFFFNAARSANLQSAVLHALVMPCEVQNDVDGLNREEELIGSVFL